MVEKRAEYEGVEEGQPLHPEWVDKSNPGRPLEAKSPYGVTHMCVLVNNFEEAVKDYNDLFDVENEDWITGIFTEKDPATGKVGDWMKGGMLFFKGTGGGPGLVALEVIQPGNPEGAMAKMVEKRGEGWHHLGFDFPSKMRRGMFKRLAAKGFKPLGDPEYGITPAGTVEPDQCRYTQLHPKYRLHRSQFEVIERSKIAYKPNRDEWLRGKLSWGGYEWGPVDEL